MRASSSSTRVGVGGATSSTVPSRSCGTSGTARSAALTRRSMPRGAGSSWAAASSSAKIASRSSRHLVRAACRPPARSGPARGSPRAPPTRAGPRRWRAAPCSRCRGGGRCSRSRPRAARPARTSVRAARELSNSLSRASRERRQQPVGRGVVVQRDADVPLVAPGGPGRDVDPPRGELLGRPAAPATRTARGRAATGNSARQPRALRGGLRRAGGARTRRRSRPPTARPPAPARRRPAPARGPGRRRARSRSRRGSPPSRGPSRTSAPGSPAGGRSARPRRRAGSRPAPRRRSASASPRRDRQRHARRSGRSGGMTTAVRVPRGRRRTGTGLAPASSTSCGSSPQPGQTISTSSRRDRAQRGAEQLARAVADRRPAPGRSSCDAAIAVAQRRDVRVGVDRPAQRERRGVDRPPGAAARARRRRRDPAAAAAPDAGAAPRRGARAARATPRPARARRTGGSSRSSRRISARAIEGAGPSISRNQIPNATSAITAVAPKIRGSAPSRWSWPAARRSSRHQRSSRERERERDEQRGEDADEGDDDPEHVRAERGSRPASRSTATPAAAAPRPTGTAASRPPAAARRAAPSARRRRSPPRSGVPR